MGDYVISCEDVDETSLVGSIRKVVDWITNNVLANGKALVVVGEAGSGKTTALFLAMRRLKRLGVSAAYINAYNELGLKHVKFIECGDFNKAHVLLIDDIDVALAMPRMAHGLIDKVLGFTGTVVMTLTIPLMVSNDLETLEPLIRLLHSAPRMGIEYHYEDLKAFAKKFGIDEIEPTVRTPGMILRNFRKWDNTAKVNAVLNDGDAVL
ncbi:MAG: ATP-binding protein [Vulcanisaeta sp. AZ3]|nr:MAG: hypothetical protein TU36_05070 [Vulcanisaeta sp. AZ3]